MEMLYKCDICKRIIEEKNTEVFAYSGRLTPQHVFCSECGKPIIDFLKKYKLERKDTKK